MNRSVLHWIVTSLALLLIAYIMPGFVITGFGAALVVALVLGFINITIKPIISFLGFPINMLTLGLSSFLINGSLLSFVVWTIPGFSTNNFWSALGVALILALMTMFIYGTKNRISTAE